ncbi:hypothetical protein GF327_02425 [Candidatus Woesearchaeota archaeon]|nr:hypothetical protein [Candidatus Woesearchaeota archaeon]
MADDKDFNRKNRIEPILVDNPFEPFSLRDIEPPDLEPPDLEPIARRWGIDPDRLTETLRELDLGSSGRDPFEYYLREEPVGFDFGGNGGSHRAGYGPDYDPNLNPKRIHDLLKEKEKKLKNELIENIIYNLDKEKNNLKNEISFFNIIENIFKYNIYNDFRLNPIPELIGEGSRSIWQNYRPQQFDPDNEAFLFVNDFKAVNSALITGGIIRFSRANIHDSQIPDRDFLDLEAVVQGFNQTHNKRYVIGEEVNPSEFGYGLYRALVKAKNRASDFLSPIGVASAGSAQLDSKIAAIINDTTSSSPMHDMIRFALETIGEEFYIDDFPEENIDEMQEFYSGLIQSAVYRLGNLKQLMNKYRNNSEYNYLTQRQERLEELIILLNRVVYHLDDTETRVDYVMCQAAKPETYDRVVSGILKNDQNSYK